MTTRLDHLRDLGNPAMGLQHTLVAISGAALAILAPTPDHLILWPLTLTAVWTMLLAALVVSGVDGNLAGFHLGPFLLALLGPAAAALPAAVERPELHHAACIATGAVLVAELPLVLLNTVRRHRRFARRERAVQQLLST